MPDYGPRQPHATPSPAVAPVSLALGHVRLATKADTTRSPVARFGVQLSRIDERGHGCILGRHL